jgi:hypothetical protein
MSAVTTCSSPSSIYITGLHTARVLRFDLDFNVFALTEILISEKGIYEHKAMLWSLGKLLVLTVDELLSCEDGEVVQLILGGCVAGRFPQGTAGLCVTSTTKSTKSTRTENLYSTIKLSYSLH